MLKAVNQKFLLSEFEKIVSLKKTNDMDTLEEIKQILKENAIQQAKNDKLFDGI